jgi:predicted NUDIX family NTP pyrophosphohydrolase
MMKNVLLILALGFLGFNTFAQIGIGTVNPNPSSILDIESTDKGFLPPRVANNNLIVNPATGLLIYNITEGCIQVNTGTPSTPNWVCLNGGGSGGTNTGNDFSQGNADWSTDLRFPDFGMNAPQIDYNQSYGITADSNLYLWGSNTGGNISSFNQPPPFNTIGEIPSPVFMDFPQFNGKVRKFRMASGIYVVLTNEGKIWIWGKQSFNIQGNGVTNGFNSFIPVELAPPAGESSYKDIAIYNNTLLFITNSGKLFYRGYYFGSIPTNPSHYLNQLAFPSGVGAGFKYTRIMNLNLLNALYLEGSDGEYYSIISALTPNFYISGNDDTPNPGSFISRDPRSSSNVYQIEFPVGHGRMKKMVSDQNRILALAENGKVYAWGVYESLAASDQYKLFKTNETGHIPGTSNNQRVFITPVEVIPPNGETSFIEIATNRTQKINYFVGGSGDLYMIGDQTLANYFFGVIFDDHSHDYVKIPTGGAVKKLDALKNGILFSSSSDEVFGLGQSNYSILGNPYFNSPTSLNSVRFFSPTPLLHKQFDPKNP